MRIVAITVGTPEAGSTRFRLMQFQSQFESTGVDLHIIPKAQLNLQSLDLLRDADIVINQKCLIGGSMARKIVQASRRLVFDFDDAIYTRPGKPYDWFTQWRVQRRFRFWLRSAHLTIAANQQLANAAEGIATRVEILPMSVDTDRWKPSPRESDEQFRIGWLGAPNNLPFLESLDPVLSELTRRFPQLRLAVLSGRRPNLSCPFEYTPFSPEAEMAFVQRLDMGLLPLSDDAHSRGKSPIKAIQYLACGVPVVGNVIGAAGEICRADNSLHVHEQEEWLSAITALMGDRQRCRALGQAGRRLVLERHCSQTNGQRFLKLLD
jgi:glycosyltransferase involved in cell wall biosynthesis